MGERAQGRFDATWDDLESAVHVPAEDQVLTEDVSVPAPTITAEDLDRNRASGMAGGYPVS